MLHSANGLEEFNLFAQFWHPALQVLSIGRISARQEEL